MERREFITRSCRMCLLGAAIGTAAAESSCSPAAGKNSFKPVIKNNQVSIPLTLFDNNNFQVVSPAGFQYEIAIQKQADNNYTALLLSCTHYQNQLTVTGNGYTCTAHGSKFDKQGNVLNGPAENSLTRLNTQIENNNLLIQL